MQQEQIKGGWSGSTLKLIAITTMLLDHIGAILLESNSPQMQTKEIQTLDFILRLIGRVAFPLFIFLLLEGFEHTHNRKKYALQLLVFGLLSEIPFDFALKGTWYDPSYQNVMFTLFLGYCAIWLYENFGETDKRILLGVFACIVLAHMLKTDYGAFGVLAIFLLYYTKKKKKYFYMTGVLLFFWEITAPIAFLLIRQYNGKRGLSLKYIFYFFYPVHILILGLIRMFVLKC